MDEKLPTDRMQAARLKIGRYMGNPCARGHSGLRYTLTGNCIECLQANVKERNARIRALLKGQDAG